MAKMVHGNADNPIRSIDHAGREFSVDDKGEFDVPAADVDVMKRHHGLVKKDQPVQK